MKLKILILCHANLVRSPFIEGYFKHLYKMSDLKDKVKIEFTSSGTEGRPNLMPDARVVSRAQEIGFYIGDHRSSHASFDTLSKADLIFVTDSKQYHRYKNYLTDFLSRTYLLTAFGREKGEKVQDIKDPTKCENDEKFFKIIDFAADETKRAWEYLELTINDALNSGRQIRSDIFEKDDEQESPDKRGYGNIFTRRHYQLCPNCQSRRLRRIERKGYLHKRIYPMFNGYPYHCGNCKKDCILYIGPNAFRHTSKKMKEAWQKFLLEDKPSNA